MPSCCGARPGSATVSVGLKPSSVSFCLAETVVAFAASEDPDGCGWNNRGLLSCAERTQRQGQARVCAQPDSFCFTVEAMCVPRPHPWP